MKKKNKSLDQREADFFLMRNVFRFNIIIASYHPKTLVGSNIRIQTTMPRTPKKMKNFNLTTQDKKKVWTPYILQVCEACEV